MATLHARDDIVRYLLLTEHCNINLQDCVSIIPLKRLIEAFVQVTRTFAY